MRSPSESWMSAAAPLCLEMALFSPNTFFFNSPVPVMWSAWQWVFTATKHTHIIIKQLTYRTWRVSIYVYIYTNIFYIYFWWKENQDFNALVYVTASFQMFVKIAQKVITPAQWIEGRADIINRYKGAHFITSCFCSFVVIKGDVFRL